MHKNAYQPKVLNGNWCEDRFTDAYDERTNQTTNTYLANPASNRYTTTSNNIGNQLDYKKVSFPRFKPVWCRKTSVTPLRTLSTSNKPSNKTRLSRPLSMYPTTPLRTATTHLRLKRPS